MLTIRDGATIGVFGHFGNRNLGDEATISAVIHNIRLRLSEAKIIGFSLHPDDTAARHGVPAYPIRYMPQRRSQRQTFGDPQNTISEASNAEGALAIGRAVQLQVAKAKAFVKTIPLARDAVAIARTLFRAVPDLKNELQFLATSYKVLKDVDVLCITGSNQFLDNFGGPWGFPYTLLKWSLIARLAHTNVVYQCVGAGPINSVLSMNMIKYAVRFSDYTSFRDRRSKDLIEMTGANCKGAVFPDLAFSLSRQAALKNTLIKHKKKYEKQIVGINPMPIFDERYWHISDTKRYEEYVQIFANFSVRLIREGCRVVFWGTQPMDQNVIADILSCMKKDCKEELRADEFVATANTVDELMDIIGTFDLVVATRFHGVVLSLLAGKAVVSVCYHKKMDDLMKEMKQSTYSIMFDALSVENLVESVKQLRENMDYEVKIIRSNVKTYSDMLSDQYDFIFGSRFKNDSITREGTKTR